VRCQTLWCGTLAKQPARRHRPGRCRSQAPLPRRPAAAVEANHSIRRGLASPRSHGTSARPCSASGVELIEPAGGVALCQRLCGGAACLGGGIVGVA
jgi:hypothetical protein